MISKRNTLFFMVVPSVLLTASLGAQTIGMVADFSGFVTVFNADTDTVIGSVELPGVFDFTTGDCSITSDQSLGFVTDMDNQVHVIDLSVPALAAGHEPDSRHLQFRTRHFADP